MSYLKLQLWWASEKLKKYFFCRFFHRHDLCWPEVWGRGLAGPWHCSKCHRCSEFMDMFEGKPIKGWLWDQIIPIEEELAE